MPARITDETLQAYSLEVQKELTDAGYRLVDMLALGVACKRHLNSFLREAEGVEEVVGFGEAGHTASTPSV
jgi:hypothetical protein